MYDGNIKAVFVHCNIFVAVHHKKSPQPLTTSLEISADARHGLWTFAPYAFINKALTETPASGGFASACRLKTTPSSMLPCSMRCASASPPVTRLPYVRPTSSRL